MLLLQTEVNVLCKVRYPPDLLQKKSLLNWIIMYRQRKANRNRLKREIVYRFYGSKKSTRRRPSSGLKLVQIKCEKISLPYLLVGVFGKNFFGVHAVISYTVLLAYCSSASKGSLSMAEKVKMIILSVIEPFYLSPN
jgi:hypothetical protein